MEAAAAYKGDLLEEVKVQSVETSFGAISLLVRSSPQLSVAARRAGNQGPTVRVFMVHGNGFCKELWLPTVDDLTKRLRATTGGGSAGVPRLEFVALDLPNHGDSAAIEFPLDWWKFGKVVAEVVQKLGYSRQGQKSGDTLIGLGHSLGAAALLMAQARIAHPTLSLRACVLQPNTFDKLLVIEPMIFPPPVYKTESPPAFLERTRRRFNAFASREAAREYFASRAFYRTWEPRVMAAFVEHGLRPDAASKDVLKLKCDPADEAEVFRVGGYHNLHEHLSEVVIPTRLLYGSDSDQYRGLGPLVLPRLNQAVTTWRKIEGTTHALPMERPDVVADELLQLIVGQQQQQQKSKAKL